VFVFHMVDESICDRAARAAGEFSRSWHFAGSLFESRFAHPTLCSMQADGAKHGKRRPSVAAMQRQLSGLQQKYKDALEVDRLRAVGDDAGDSAAVAAAAHKKSGTKYCHKCHFPRKKQHSKECSGNGVCTNVKTCHSLGTGTPADADRLHGGQVAAQERIKELKQQLDAEKAKDAEEVCVCEFVLLGT
jgi:hypothetical protein